MTEETAGTPTIDIVFDGPPSHESGRFVEVEDSTGRSINAGEWICRSDGFWVLRMPDPREVAALTTQREEAGQAYKTAIREQADQLQGWKDRTETAEAQRDELQKRIGYTAVPSDKPCESKPASMNWETRLFQYLVNNDVIRLMGARRTPTIGSPVPTYEWVQHGIRSQIDIPVTLATSTAQATECETNETEGLRAELDAAKRALAEVDKIAEKLQLARAAQKKMPVCKTCNGYGLVPTGECEEFNSFKSVKPCPECSIERRVKDRRAALAAKSTEQKEKS